MENELNKTSEDLYADVDFEEDGDENELKDAEFISVEPASVKLSNVEEGKKSEFYDENDKLVAEKIVDKKTGKITEIKYDALGQKESVIIRRKDKSIIKATDYYANGALKLVTDYGNNGAYKSMMYQVDGSWLSYVDKHEDGTADAIYYDTDGKGTKLLVKLDANKQVIEQRVEQD